MISVDDYLALPSEAAERARAVSLGWNDAGIDAHSVRAWIFAAALGDAERIPYDPEILCVASMLHDLALHEPFDAHRTPFEYVGGAVSMVFAIGAGLGEDAARSIADAIEDHMRDAVDVRERPEGYLLEASTALDVSGRDTGRWDRRLLREVAGRLPRGDFAETFAAAIHRQAARKRTSTAAALDASGRIRRGEAIWNGIVAG